MSQKLPNPRPSYPPPSPPPKPPSATLTELATIARLQEENDALRASVNRLTDEMNMWWGVAIRRGDEMANLRRQLDSALSMNEMLKDQLREKR